MPPLASKVLLAQDCASRVTKAYGFRHIGKKNPGTDAGILFFIQLSLRNYQTLARLARSVAAAGLFTRFIKMSCTPTLRP